MDFWEEKPHPSLLTCDAAGGLLSEKVRFASRPLARGCTAVEGRESAIVAAKINNQVIVYPRICDYRK